MRTTRASDPRLGGLFLYVLVTGIYALSRVGLYLLGVRFHADYLWQHFHDVDLLEHRLWESLLYTHAFTPFMNLLAGVVLKISPAHSVAIYHAIYLLVGWLFIQSMTYLMRAFCVSAWLTVAVVTFFACSPPFIYFENFLHYEFLAAAFLALAAVLFHRALVAESWSWWFLFFLDCMLITYVRTTFHLVWLVAVVVMAALFKRQHWRRIATAAALPAALVVALYAKNEHYFGFFGSSSMFGFNLAYMTTKQMSAAERHEWVVEGKVHPIAEIDLYAGPEAYAQYVDLGRNTGIPVLDRLRREGGVPNYNHWSYAEMSKLRMEINRFYLANCPWRYVVTVLEGYGDYFRPTTRWHPKDPEGSPHQENRRVLLGWENLYNGLFHRFPVSPWGLYLLVVPALLYAAAKSLFGRRQRGQEQKPPERLMVFLVFNCIYVPVLSCLVTIGELERYRFMVESFMWIATVVMAQRAVARRSVLTRRPGGAAPSSLPPVKSGHLREVETARTDSADAQSYCFTPDDRQASGAGELL